MQHLHDNKTTFRTCLRHLKKAFYEKKVLKFYVIHQNMTESLDHETLL